MELQEFYRKSLLISQFLSWLIFQATWFILRKTGRNVIHIWGQYLLSGPSLWGELAVEDQDAASVLCMTLLLVQKMKDPFLSKNIFCSLQTKFPRFDYTFTEIGIVYKKNSGFNNSNSMHMLMYEGSPINRRQCGFVFLHLFRGFN